VSALVLPAFLGEEMNDVKSWTVRAPYSIPYLPDGDEQENAVEQLGGSSFYPFRSRLKNDLSFYFFTVDGISDLNVGHGSPSKPRIKRIRPSRTVAPFLDNFVQPHKADPDRLFNTRSNVYFLPSGAFFS
jgi:hypothetical protein